MCCTAVDPATEDPEDAAEPTRSAESGSRSKRTSLGSAESAPELVSAESAPPGAGKCVPPVGAGERVSPVGAGERVWPPASLSLVGSALGQLSAIRPAEARGPALGVHAAGAAPAAPPIPS